MKNRITTIIALIWIIILGYMIAYWYTAVKNANEAVEYIKQQQQQKDYISTLSWSIEANSLKWDNLQLQIESLKKQQEKLHEANIYLQATKEQEEWKMIDNYKKDMGLI